MGWNYALNWLTVLPLEIVSASITVDYWVWVMPGGARYLVNGDEQVQNIGLNAAWVSIFLVLIVLINFFGVKGYGEAEFLFSIVKVTAVIGYM
jgi:yeast amino acid transporter